MRLSISRTPPTQTASASSAGAGHHVDLRQRVRIADLGVLEPRQRLGRDRGRGTLDDHGGRGVARGHCRCRRGQRARHAARRGTRLGAEQPVAARQRQAVGLAHRRHADDLDAEVEVGGHAADHRELLAVLLAEDRDVRAGRRGRASSPRW